MQEGADMDSQGKKESSLLIERIWNKTFRTAVIAIAILLFAALVVFLAVQKPLVLQGTIMDASTNKPIRGVTVSAGNRQVTTDASGHFSLSVRQEPPDISIMADGYSSVRVPAQKSLNILLAATPRLVVKRWCACYKKGQFSEMTPDMVSAEEGTLTPSELKESLTAQGFAIHRIEIRSIATKNRGASARVEIRTANPEAAISRLDISLPLIEIKGTWRIVWPFTGSMSLRFVVENKESGEPVSDAEVSGGSSVSSSDSNGFALLQSMVIPESIEAKAPGYQPEKLTPDDLVSGITGIPPAFQASILEENVYPVLLRPFPKRGAYKDSPLSKEGP